MTLELTAVFRKDAEGGYVAFVEELAGANTQGDTLDEARANLREAVELILETRRALLEEDLAGAAAQLRRVRRMPYTRPKKELRTISARSSLHGRDCWSASFSS